MRCAAPNTTSMSCSVNSSVRPRSLAMRRSSAIDSRVSVALMPAVGSSSSRISGLPASAMPSSSCFWLPYDSVPPASCALSARFTSASSAIASSRYTCSARDHRSRPRPRCAISAACTFWNTESFGKMLVRWNERATPSAHSLCGAMPVTSRPASVTRPASGFRWPVSRLNSVDLPAPLGPMMATISWRATARLTPSIAATPPNARLRSCASIMAPRGV